MHCFTFWDIIGNFSTIDSSFWRGNKMPVAQPTLILCVILSSLGLICYLWVLKMEKCLTFEPYLEGCPYWAVHSKPFLVAEQCSPNNSLENLIDKPGSIRVGNHNFSALSQDSGPYESMMFWPLYISYWLLIHSPMGLSFQGAVSNNLEQWVGHVSVF